MTKSIEQIASTHLGKAGDGTVVKPYVTPVRVDKTLLVAIPRVLNRTQYDIDDNDLPFVGYDVWNGYEFSALTDNGFPVVGHMKLVYAANSKSIVESKSLKLYLNSFNMDRLGGTREEVLEMATNIITDDLRELLGESVKVHIFSTADVEYSVAPMSNTLFYKDLESKCDVENILFDKYSEAPELLTGKKLSTYAEYDAKASILRSNCRVTNQPDWGDVFIYLTSRYDVDSAGLLQYLVSMRRENHFHEEICECIYKRLQDAFSPKELFVACLYTRRGGIDINPVRASSAELIDAFSRQLVSANSYTKKLWRQ